MTDQEKANFKSSFKIYSDLSKPLTAGILFPLVFVKRLSQKIALNIEPLEVKW